MFAKIKVFGQVVACCLLLGTGFLTPLSSGQKTLNAVEFKPAPTEVLKGWTEVDRKTAFAAMFLKGSSSIFFYFLIANSHTFTFTNNKGQETTYQTDLIAPALQAQIKVQKKLIKDFEPTQFSPESQNQLLQFVAKDGNFKQDGNLIDRLVAEHEKSVVSLWNDIRLLLYQMQTLEVSKYKDYWGKEQDLTNLLKSTSKLDHFEEIDNYDQLVSNVRFAIRMLLISSTISPLFTQLTFTTTLNNVWLSKLKLLQSVPDLKVLNVSRGKVNVSILTSSNAQSIADLLKKDQIDTLAKLKDLSLQELQNQVAVILNPYKKTIQPSLNLFAKYGITKISLNNTEYDLSELLKADNINQPVVTLSVPAIQQLGNLYKATPRITPAHFDTAFAPFAAYKTTIQDNLNLFAKYENTSLTLNSKSYSLDKLLDSTNLQKKAADLDPGAARQLGNLYKNNITTKQLNDALDLLISSYKKTIQPSLKALATNSVDQIIINDRTYLLNHLLAKENLASPGSQLEGEAQNQLVDLFKTKITKQQLDDSLVTILATRKKAQKKKNLTIGLATGGSVVVLAGVGGFLYWFYKVKK